ncbi:BAHD acyltransferase DCR [Hibiscus syriacus]|uniref:BAHD acyltransferase DCR n=1 Tax=Hibiscus syriacus TaxID=106335 RepID=A0A6A3AL26_HIBSY|nr:BAHD acyltransferase DCR-like [Hibiscus syriacus]KAE8705290.1 BAHD acyltransferase DCR [Hibiscus syriacus]
MAAGALIKEEETSKVKITGKTHVKPGNIIGRKECQLVTFDLPYLAFYYNQKLLFYKCEGFEEKVEKLKDGMRVVLEEFYQLAGKLGKDEEGVFRADYDDDMDGVEVLEAVAEEIAVDELAADEGTSSLKDLIPYNGVLNLEGLHRPLLSVQLTKLKDGVAMGCAFNHAVLDGTSTWHFMSSWAQICSGSTNSVAVPPFLERTKARNTRVKLDLSLPPNPIAASNGGAHQLREKLFRFPEAAIDKIKSNVNSNPPTPGSKPFSTFQSLAVHIWQHVSKARNLKPEDYTVFTVFADCRKRVDPPMPESYFGNLIQAIFTVTAAGLLLANQLDFGASVIQKAIEAHDAKAIEERNKEWEAAPKIFEFKDAGVNCVAVGSSPRFKVYDVDFGWGEPEGVRSGSNNRFDGMVYLYQGKSGGRSIDVEITLEAGAMEQLEKDEGFLMEV